MPLFNHKMGFKMNLENSMLIHRLNDPMKCQEKIEKLKTY